MLSASTTVLQILNFEYIRPQRFIVTVLRLLYRQWLPHHNNDKNHNSIQQAMTSNNTTGDTSTEDDTTITTTHHTVETTSEKPVWTRLNYKGPLFHDNRRLLKHRAKNCECHVCTRELKKLPPMETHAEYIASCKFEEREIKRAKKRAKKEVKDGKQKTIRNFFKTTGSP